MMVLALAIGLFTPPVGTTLFISSSIARVPIFSVVRKMWPCRVVADPARIQLRACSYDPLTATEPSHQGRAIISSCALASSQLEVARIFVSNHCPAGAGILMVKLCPYFTLPSFLAQTPPTYDRSQDCQQS
jgi:hypothetical protein